MSGDEFFEAGSVDELLWIVRRRLIGVPVDPSLVANRPLAQSAATGGVAAGLCAVLVATAIIEARAKWCSWGE